MKLKKVCLCLVVVLFVLLLNEISCIANRQENLIGDEDRRAAESYDADQKTGASKRGLYEASGTHNRHQTYPSDYSAAATFSSPGHAYGPPSGHGYYPTSGHGSYGLFSQTGHGYGHTAPGHDYGYGHTAPSHEYGHTAPAHGHGHNGLALKGLLIPLAGIALIGAAAALSHNPVLLQLGVVNGRRRRRRRDVSSYSP